MASNDVRIVITADARQAKSELKEVEGSAHKVGSAFGDMAKIAGGFVIGTALTKLPGLLTGATGAASDLNESLSKARTVFGDASASVEAFAATTTKSMGLSKGAALAATGSFGNLFTAMGLSKQQAASTSIDVVKLAGDLASFHNLNVDDALEKLRAGLVGEAEPLRAMGIQMNAAMVEAKALELGLGDANGEVSEAAKVQARLAIIMAQTTVAQGDFARTAEGAANKQRILSATAADMQAQLGAKLLPAWIAIQDVMLTKVIPALAEVGEWFQKMAPTVRELADTIADKLRPALDATIGFLGRHTEILWGVAAAIGVGLVAAFTAWAIAAGAAAVSTIAAVAPVLAVGVAIAALVAGIIWLVRNWGDLEEKYPALERATNKVQAAFEAFTAWIQSDFVPLVKQISIKVGEVAADLVAIYNEKIKPVMEGIIEASAAVVQWFNDHWGTIMTIVQPIIDQLTLHIQSMAKIFQATVLLIKALITGDWDAAWKQAGKIVDTFVDLIRGSFENLYKIITAAIAIVRDLAAYVGKAIVNGIREGIEELWDGLKNWFSDKVGGLVNDAKNALKIWSPSQVMKDEVGEPIVEGIQKGIEDAWPGLTSALAEMIQGLVTDAAAGAALITGILGSAPSATGPFIPGGTQSSPGGTFGGANLGMFTEAGFNLPYVQVPGGQKAPKTADGTILSNWAIPLTDAEKAALAPLSYNTMNSQPQTITVNVVLDGDVIAQSVVNNLGKAMA